MGVMLMLLQHCCSQCLQEPEPALAVKDCFGDGLGTAKKWDSCPSAAGDGFRGLGWAGDKLLSKVTPVLLCFCFVVSFSLLCSLHFSLQPLLEAPFL